MALIWSKLKPQDKYKVLLTAEPSLFEIKLLGQLYQPIMGHTAYSLYLTFLSEVQSDEQVSATRNHQWLMNIMCLPLDKLYQARLRLEALGLLKTFHTKLEELGIVEYHLLPPLTAAQFFQEDILSICLYNQVGANRYRELRNRYTLGIQSQSKDNENREEVTKEFHEVFTSIHPSELVLKEGTEQEDELGLTNHQLLLSSSPELDNQLKFERYQLDLEELKGFFMKGIEVNNILTPKNLREIKKVAFFYQFDTWSLSRVIQDSLTLEDELDLALFREKAKDWYRLQQGGKPPQIVHYTQPLAKRQFHQQEPQSEEEKHLAKLETISPIELLEAYQGGGKIAEADLKLVEELIFDYELYPAVVNLLLEYVLLTNEYKLPKNLVTKIAAHWKRLKITNIREAHALALREHQQYKAWQEQKQEKQTEKVTSTKPGARKAVTERRDILPDWIANPSKYESSETGTTSLTDKQKRERAEQLLKSLGEWQEKGEE